jgi:hypothetical protein
MRSIAIFSLWLILCIGTLFFCISYLRIISIKSIANLKDQHSNNFILSDYIIDKPQIRPVISPENDIRILALKKFFHEYNSILEFEAENFVKSADVWGLDYTLLPAIAMQESGGCKKIPVDSYNCWGFGIYGTKKTVFSSYNEGIETVAKTIKESYIKSGLTNATLVEDIWVPPSKGQWSYSVNFFIGKIKEYERLLSGT